MTTTSVLDTYIIRVYRVDPEDCRRITGLIETIDGNGIRTPFDGLDELNEIICSKYRKHKVIRKTDSKKNKTK